MPARPPDMACLGCRSLARLGADHSCGRGDGAPLWGWKRTDDPGDCWVTWAGGTLEESYNRVARDGGTWILYSAWPVAEYDRVMAETAAREEAA